MAGRFYPADPDTLLRTVEECITRGRAGWRPPGSGPCAVISPHAGYPFSGWLTGAAWRATARLRPKTVVILSPSHQHAFDGVALPSARAYAMPGFNVVIDDRARDALTRAGLAHVEDAAHDREHGIETQLPFLRRLHPQASVVPLVIGRVGGDRVPKIIDLLSSTSTSPPLFVLSSDLSHFLTLDRANALDAETARLIETGEPEQLTSAHACGVGAVAGFLTSSFGRDTRIQRLAMANSAAASGDTTRTVGYGAWALFETMDDIILPRHREELLRTARAALTSRLKTGKMPHVDETTFATALRGYGAAFVTLKQDGRLRGCIGSQKAHMPLVRDVVRNAVKAGTEDPRFKPVTPGELEQIQIGIAVLSPSVQMHFDDEDDLLNQLVPGRDGLILSDGERRGVFLPSVWESLPEPAVFLNGLKVKADLPKDYWSASVRVRRFCAESMSETG